MEKRYISFVCLWERERGERVCESMLIYHVLPCTGTLYKSMQKKTWVKSSIPGQLPRLPMKNIQGVNVLPYILADPAFDTVGPHVMKRFQGAHLTRAQKLWNLIQSSGRQTIEHAWGRLTRRFRFLRHVLNFGGDDWFEKVSVVIVACMVLHNVCIDKEDLADIGEDSESDSDSDNDDEIIYDDQWSVVDPREYENKQQSEAACRTVQNALMLRANEMFKLSGDQRSYSTR